MDEKEAKKIALKHAKKLVSEPELIKIEERYFKVLPNNDPNYEPKLEKVWYSEFSFESMLLPGLLKLHIDDKGKLLKTSKVG